MQTVFHNLLTLIGLLILSMTWRTHEAVQQKTPLTTVAGNNLRLPPTVPPQVFPLSPRCASGCSLAVLSFSFPQEPKSAQFWCLNCCPFRQQGLTNSNTSLELFLVVASLLYFHIVVDLISCLASISSKFSEDISDGTHQASLYLNFPCELMFWYGWYLRFFRAIEVFLLISHIHHTLGFPMKVDFVSYSALSFGFLDGGYK